MFNPSVPCAVSDRGVACGYQATTTMPIPLCTPHRVEVAMGVAAAFRDRPSVPSLTAQVDVVLPFFGGAHEEIVYFLVNGTRVKIGRTTHLRARVESLSLARDSVVLALAGGRDLEAALHRAFADVRVGETEWFEYASDIRVYVQMHAATGARLVKAPDDVDGHAVRETVSAREVRDVTRGLIGEHRGVLLTTIRDALNLPNTRAVRGVLATAGLRVRDGVRTPGGNGPGVHRDDMPAELHPVTTA